MSEQEKPYQFLYENYVWPEKGTKRDCPYADIPLQLNEQRPGYNGKPWTCPQCIHYFSEEDLNNPAQYKGKDCAYTLRQKNSAEVSEAPSEEPAD